MTADTTPPPVPPVPPASADNTTPTLAAYAQRAYLEYALSVVKGRALPDVADGQKPVQRRILYAMTRLGLSWGSSGAARPVKSARVVGDVLGRFHPHGDQAAYDALVRMAQDFSQRYPLIDGQGNFGSRDGDSAAAMRYTEARLAPIATLLTDELDMGTTHYVPNYDGSTQEPQQLPARLPFNLLNGASGIAVGMACEIPSHNLREVAHACTALLEQPDLPDAELMTILPGPDYPGGGHIISEASEVADAYRTGRGSLKVRARWVVEELARGQWQLVITELPPGVSTQKVLEEIEDITNPRVKAGKKALTPEQNQLKAHLLSLLDGVRDESSKDAPVRIVLEPRSRSVAQDEFINTLLAHTSLETSCTINLTAVGLDGRPTQHSLRQLLLQWLDFRRQTITRRSQHRLEQVRERMHLLQGRQTVLLHIDEVIAIIRTSDEPRDELMTRFALSPAQADDILDIRLRQLARLEAIKIEQELARLGQEHDVLQDVLGSPASLQRLMAEEIRRDAAQFGDTRRTLIQPQKRASAGVRVQDEAVTVVVSTKGWVRTRSGHGHDAASFQFKPGDALYATFECRSVDSLIAFGSSGRVYSVAVSALPGGRGDGQPVASLIELEAGTQITHYYAGSPHTRLLLAHSGGYGFIASVGDMVSRQRAGKAFVACHPGEVLFAPVPLPAVAASAAVSAAASAVTSGSADSGTDGGAGDRTGDGTSGHADSSSLPPWQVACVSSSGRLLSFALEELRTMPGGGRGLMLMGLSGDDTLAGVAVYRQRIRVSGSSRMGKPRSETLDARTLDKARSVRGRKGRDFTWGFQIQQVDSADGGSGQATP